MSNCIGIATMVIQGRLTEDPEFRKLDNGTEMCKFRVAVNRRVGGGERTSFIPVTVFGREANNCYQYLSRGRIVGVVGDFETDRYTGSDGVERTGFGIVAQKVDFGSGGRRADEEDGNTPVQSENQNFDNHNHRTKTRQPRRSTTDDMRDYLNNKKNKRRTR